MKKTFLTIAIVALSGVVIFWSCSKQPVMPSHASLYLNLKHFIDDAELEFDAIKYINEAGNEYSVSKLEYFISNIALKNSNGAVYKSKITQYVNAANAKTNKIFLDSIAPGTYTELSFLIGLSAEQNVSNSLPSIPENNNMYWPDHMGGGYHFMKFEGHFNDTTATPGFAVHLGKTAYVVKIKINKQIKLTLRNQKQTLSMNLNEWFRNPNVFDLKGGNNYTMSNDSLMNVISKNGVDVFTLPDK
jgi:hypothetical protein